jgi:general secretion pathway protein F
MLLTRELATMLNAGLPLDHGLGVLARLSHKPAVSRMLNRVRGEVEAGVSLSDAMQKEVGVFSPFYINMVRAGESTGMVEQTLERLAEYEERSQGLREAVRSALIYPALLFLIAGASLVVLLTYVVPRFEPLFADMGAALPWSTAMVISVARALESFWWAIPFVVLLGFYVGRRAFRDAELKRAWDRGVLRIPVLGDLLLQIEMARFSRTLGTLLANGVPLLTGLGIIKDTLQNTLLLEATNTVANSLEQGKGLARPMEEAACFPELAVQLIQVGEDTGKLDAMLMKIAEIYDADVERTLKRALALLEPALILGMGAVIGFIIISILLAILGLNEFVL